MQRFQQTRGLNYEWVTFLKIILFLLPRLYAIFFLVRSVQIADSGKDLCFLFCFACFSPVLLSVISVL